MRQGLRERWRQAGRRARWALAAGVVVVLVGAGTGAWALSRGDSTAAQTLTVQASTGTVKQTVSASGTVAAADEADLDFAVSGTVTKVYVAEGDTVTKGQALAKVDDTSLVAARTAAQSSLTAAQEQYETDAASGASDVQVASDQAAVVSAKADLASAKQAVSDSVLRATIAGTVTSLDLAVGDVVSGSGGSGSGGSGGSGSSGTSGGSGGSGGAGGTGAGRGSAGSTGSSSSSASSSSSSSSTAVTIVSTGSYVVDGTVSADDAAKLKPSLQATITVNGLSSTVFGTVATVGKVAQASSTGAAVFPVTIDVTGQVKGLYAGSSATAAITVKQRTNVLTVMSRAIQSSGGSTYVMKVGKDGKAVRTPVTIGEVYGATTEITQGLADGDTVQVPGISLPRGTGTGGGEGRGVGRLGGGQGGFGGGGFGGAGLGGGGRGGAGGGFGGGGGGGFGGAGFSGRGQ